MLITILVALIIIALIYWVITTLPLPSIVRTIAIVVVVLFACIYLLGLIAPGSTAGLL